jgi:hypothetical protein
MAGRKPRVTRVDEEKLLNEIFVVLEYSDSFKEFCDSLSKEATETLHMALHGVFPNEGD